MQTLIVLVMTLLTISPQPHLAHRVPAANKGQVDLVKVIPIQDPFFIQGLELSQDGALYLGTGHYGESQVGTFDFQAGQFIPMQDLPDTYFGEGISIREDALWQLTWKEGVVLKRSLTDLGRVDQFEYSGEGWGLAYDPDRDLFWMSDGSSSLYQQDSEAFTRLDDLQVTWQGRPVTLLNELEYANQALYANIWYDHHIIKIDPETGQVQLIYDLDPILQDIPISPAQAQEMDALNGIAHIEADRFYLTGKNFPFLLEVHLRDN
ncbi:glutaminyl-peptide cyclotransferase [Facklamia languida]